MKITLAVLFLAGLAIYCKCAAVLSLPPSLIAHAAASLDDGQTIQKSSAFKDNEIPTAEQQQQLRQYLSRKQANAESLQDATATTRTITTATATKDLNRNFKNLWHKNLSFIGQKRERNTFDDDIDNVDDVVPAIKQNGLRQHDNDNNVHGDGDDNNNNEHKDNSNNNNENKNENMFLKASAAAILNDDNQLIDLLDHTMESSSLSEKSFHKREATSSTGSEILNRYFKPLKHGANRCTWENQDNCLQEYYGDLIANRNKALLKQKQQQHHKENMQASSQLLNNISNDDIVLFLTAEQNLIKFLSWALSELYPFGKFTNANANADSADSYHPGMYMWKKLNLSGRLQPPLLIEEPHYVIVRKEFTANDEDEENDYEYKRGLNYGRDPFIPPRGRKHNLPDLDSLLHRYETFVPNRGRRDKIKDIFKYDDLFYPNRGKRQMIVTPATAAAETAATATQSIIDNNGDTDESQVNNYDDDYNHDDIKYHDNEENAKHQKYQQQLTDPLLSSNELYEYIENLMAKIKRKLPQYQQQQTKQQQNNEKIANSFDEMMSNSKEPTTTRMSSTSASWPKSLLLLNKRFKSTMFNILHNRQQKHNRQQHLPKHYRNTRQWWKRYPTSATEAAAAATIDHDGLLSMIRSPTMATNRLQTLRSMSAQQQQQLKQLFEQQHGVDLSPPHMNVGNTKFMWHRQQQQRQPKSLAQQFDPLSWHKLQMLQQQQQQHDYQPSLTIRHPRLTALQHLPAVIQQQQQQHVATPQETQLTFASDQLDNSKTNDLDYMDNKMDLD